VYKQKAELLLW